jgi:hypothetical protein
MLKLLIMSGACYMAVAHMALYNHVAVSPWPFAHPLPSSSTAGYHRLDASSIDFDLVRVHLAVRHQNLGLPGFLSEDESDELRVLEEIKQ